jgi:hypothetical protein
MSKLRNISAADHSRLVWCETQLRNVRDNVKKTGASRTADAVRHALKSIGGAIRHAENAQARQGREAIR